MLPTEDKYLKDSLTKIDLKLKMSLKLKEPRECLLFEMKLEKANSTPAPYYYFIIGLFCPCYSSSNPGITAET